MIMKLVNMATGRRYWYSVRLAYHSNKTGRTIASRSLTVGVCDRREMMNLRKFRKLHGWSALVKDIPRYMLCNGHIVVTINGYLGWFKGMKKGGAA